MIKVVKVVFLLLLLSGCAYEPILLKNNYDFNFIDINSSGNQDINQIIKNKILLNTKKKSSTKIKISFQSKKDKTIISSNKKGDPIIYKITIKLKYNIEENEKIILRNEITKQTTYNNIDDKFELLKKEENMTKNLSEKVAEDILISITTLLK